MATLTINFQATTTGVHHIGYRSALDPANTYTVLDVDVIVPGAQAVDIDVSHNMYCADQGMGYHYYVIAACQDQTDSNADGVPDIALTDTVQLQQQVDPCIEHVFTCQYVPIASVNIDTAGVTCNDGTYTLDIAGGGELEAANIEVVVSGNVATSINIIDPGKYQSAPTLTIPAAASCGTDPTFTATLGNCPLLDLRDYICGQNSDLSAVPEYTLTQGEIVRFYANEAAVAGLPDNFTESGSDYAHCQPCSKGTVTVPGATAGQGKISYQTCWDGTNAAGDIVLVTRVVNFGDTIDLGCILPDSFISDQGTLDAAINLSTVGCDYS